MDVVISYNPRPMANSSKNKRAWPDCLKKRLRKLRARTKKAGLDALLISNEPDIRYLTHFKGEDALLLVTPRQVYVLSDFRFIEEIERVSPFLRLILRNHKAHTDLLRELVGDLRIQKLGIQEEYMTVMQRQRVAKAVGAKKLKSINGWLSEQRSIKDEYEIKLIRKAIRIQERALQATMEEIEPGMTERQLAGVLEYNMKWLGADNPAFSTIVGAGPNSSLCHYTPDNKPIRRGQVLLIDFGANYRGYHSDMTRTFGVGKMPKRIRKIYPIVHEAFLAARDILAPGVPLVEVDQAARGFIRDAGFGKYFGHGLGHGIGLNIHEAPGIGSKAKQKLQAGQVLTIEPGIYLPGIGGVRLENDILITETGHKDLCSLPMGLESAIIPI